MFVILNALKYLYFKEFFSTFLLLYFFSTHVKEHVDNLIASSDYFTRLLNENVNEHSKLPALYYVSWTFTCYVITSQLLTWNTKKNVKMFWVETTKKQHFELWWMHAKGEAWVWVGHISELDQRPDVCFWHLNAGVKFGLNPTTPSLSPACSPNNFWTAYLEWSLNPRFQQKLIFRLPMVFGPLCSP